MARNRKLFNPRTSRKRFRQLQSPSFLSPSSTCWCLSAKIRIRNIPVDKTFPFGDFDHPLGTSGLAPIVSPVNKILVPVCGPLSAPVDLGHVFPSGNPQATGKNGEFVFMSIQSRTLEPHVEAFGATSPRSGSHSSPLTRSNQLRTRNPHPRAPLPPCRKISCPPTSSVRIHAWVNVRVVKEDGRLDGGLQQGLQHLALAWGAAGMKQYPRRSPRCFQLWSGCRIHDHGEWQVTNEMAIGYSVADSALRSRAIRSEMAIEGALPWCRIEYISVRIGISTPESRHFSKNRRWRNNPRPRFFGNR